MNQFPFQGQWRSVTGCLDHDHAPNSESFDVRERQLPAEEDDQKGMCVNVFWVVSITIEGVLIGTPSQQSSLSAGVDL